MLIELIFTLFIGVTGCVLLFNFYFHFLMAEFKLKKEQFAFLEALDCMNFVINEITTRGIEFPILISRNNRSYFLFLTSIDGEEKVVGYYAYEDANGLTHVKRFASSDQKLIKKIRNERNVSEGFLRQRIDGWNTLYEGDRNVEFQFEYEKLFVIKIGEYFRSCIVE